MITINRDFNTLARVEPEALRGTSFNSEQGAHTFVIRRVENGTENPFPAGTGVTGKFLSASGGSYDLSGAVEDGRATLTLIPACYAVTGRFLLTIMATSGDDHTVIYAAVGSVTDTTGTGSVVPGGTVPNYADLIDDMADAQAELERVEATIPADYSTLSAKAVRVDQAQDFTQTEKKQARQNADAVPEVALRAELALQGKHPATVLERWVGNNNSVTWIGNSEMLTLNGTSSSGFVVSLLGDGLLGATGTTTPSTAQLAKGPFAVVEGHVYRMRMRLVSGTRTGGSACYVQMFDTDGEAISGAKCTETQKETTFTMDRTEIGQFCAFFYRANTFTDAVYAISLEDITVVTGAMPKLPTANGTYTLQVTITGGVPVYAWVAASGTASLLSSPLSMTAPDTTDTDPEEGDTE